MRNFVYLVEGTAGRAFLVDPAWDVPRFLEEAKRLGLRITDALLTHGHPDHVNGVAALRKATGARVWAHESSDQSPDEKLRDGQRVTLAGVDVETIHTPGHRFDSACYVLDGTHVLTGDTLFVGDCGRVDLPGSDPVAMHRSLLSIVRGLDDALVVLSGHDYGPTPTSTMGREKRENPALRERTVHEFVAYMREP